MKILKDESIAAAVTDDFTALCIVFAKLDIPCVILRSGNRQKKSRRDAAALNRPAAGAAPKGEHGATSEAQPNTCTSVLRLTGWSRKQLRAEKARLRGRHAATFCKTRFSDAEERGVEEVRRERAELWRARHAGGAPAQ